ncbi:ParB/RepB/Spo0J family partition protein [Planctomycetota bacterium]
MTNQIHSIKIDKLKPHPGNPNRMPTRIFNKLVHNIERTGRYEPIVVRPKDGCFEIINGYHRCLALKQLGYEKADAVIWDVDQSQADVLLMTLNRLSGSDILQKKIDLLKRLVEQINPCELAKLLPGSAKQIERLSNIKPPKAPAKIQRGSQNIPLMFFVSDSQQKRIERAMSLASKNIDAKTKALRKAQALATIAETFCKTE